MKTPILILSASFLFLNTCSMLRADTVFSNLDQTWSDPGGSDSGIRGFGAGTGYGVVFQTGKAPCKLTSITLQHFWYQSSELPTVRLFRAPALPVTSSSDDTLVAYLGNPQVLQETPSLSGSSFVAWQPMTAVVLEPSSTYFLAITGGLNASSGNYVIFTSSDSFQGTDGWGLGATSMGMDFGYSQIWWGIPGELKFQIDGTIEVIANNPPDISGARASVSTLWPPNGTLVPFTVVGVTDPDGDPVTVAITGIQQDEPLSGDYSYDAVITGTSAMVRAARTGDGNGRVYTISFTASDGKPGGEVSGVVTIGVPHSSSIPAVDDGPIYTSTAK